MVHGLNLLPRRGNHNAMAKEYEGDLFTGRLKRITRSVSTPGEAEDIIQARLKLLGMTFQEYVASLITYDCWAEKPHALTGDICKGHLSAKEAQDNERRLWAEIRKSRGLPDKTGSYFGHVVAEFVRKKLG